MLQCWALNICQKILWLTVVFITKPHWTKNVGNLILRSLQLLKVLVKSTVLECKFEKHSSLTSYSPFLKLVVLSNKHNKIRLTWNWSEQRSLSSLKLRKIGLNAKFWSVKLKPYRHSTKQCNFGKTRNYTIIVAYTYVVPKWYISQMGLNWSFSLRVKF